MDPTPAFPLKRKGRILEIFTNLQGRLKAVVFKTFDSKWIAPSLRSSAPLAPPPPLGAPLTGLRLHK